MELKYAPKGHIMARDVVKHYSNAVYTRTFEYEPPIANPRPDQIQGGSHLRLSKSRGDIQKSNRVSPTPYFAKTYIAGPSKIAGKKPWQKAYGKLANGRNGFYYYREVRKGLYGLTVLGLGESDTNVWNPLWPTSSSSAAYSSVTRKILDSDFDLGETLGEADSSLRTVYNVFLRAAQGINHLKRGQFRKAANVLGIPSGQGPKAHLDAASNAYLTIKFGIIPLMDALFNGVEHVKKARSSPHGLVRVTSTVSVEGAPMYGQVTGYTTKGTLTRGTKYGIVYRVSDSYKHSLSRLNIQNPLSVAWELLPLSFVIDWFINVGPTLRALQAPIGLTLVQGYETRFCKGSYELQRVVSIGGYPPYTCNYPITINAMGRRTFTSFPNPSPWLSSKMSTGKVVTALALLNQKGQL